MAVVPYVLLVVTVPQTRMIVVLILVRMTETALTELIATLVPASQVTLGTTAKRVRTICMLQCTVNCFVVLQYYTVLY